MDVVDELVRKTRMPAEDCRDALQQNGGDVGAALRVLVLRRDRDADRTIKGTPCPGPQFEG